MDKYVIIIAILAAVIFLMFLIPFMAHSPQTCHEFKSKEEMLRAFRTGLIQLDRDGDKVPCEGVVYK